MPDRGLQESGSSLAKVVIWDTQGSPPVDGDGGTTVLWRGFGDDATPGVVSIPRLIEANADILRKRYLAWVYELGETRVEGRCLVDHLELRPGFSYWWMTLLAEKCNYSKSPQIESVIRLMAFDDWAAGHAVDCIVLASANKPLAECLRLWCAKSGVEFEWRRISKRPVRWMRRIYQSLPLTLQAMTGLFRYLIDRWPLRGVGVKEWQQTNGQVTFVSYLFNLVPDAAKEGQYESRYWAHLPNVLQSEGCKTNWLHLYIKDALLPDASKAAGIIRNFNRMERGEQAHVTLDAFLTARVVLRTLKDWSRLVRTGRRLRQAISSAAGEKLYLWPLVAEDWRQSTGGFTALSNALNLNLFESAMRSLPQQRAGVYLQENQGWEFGLIQAWKAAGHGRLYGCPHTSVRFWDLRYFFDPRSYGRAGTNPLPLPDRVVLNGVAATTAYVAGGYPVEDLIQVEALRYLYLDGVNHQAEPESDQPKGRLRLLVLGDYLPSNTQLQMHLLERAAQSFPNGTEVMVKPHPACPIRAEDYPGLRMTITTEPVFVLLPKCDVAYASPVTSAAVDAYCAGVPVISVLDPDTLHLSPLRGQKDVMFVSTPEELAYALNSAVFTLRSARNGHNFFLLDPTLPRWRELLMRCNSPSAAVHE